MRLMPRDEVSPTQNTDKRARLDLLARFHTDQAEHRQTWTAGQGQVPRPLHHYTTIDGLVGIMSTNSLWASDVRYMNDSSEFSYAAELIESVVAEVLKEVPGGPLQAALPSRPGFANGFEFGAQPFAACFCEAQDLLSQWRGYGVGEAGVSLGLDLLQTARIADPPGRIYLRKVIYDPEEQRAAVRNVVETWIQTADALLDTDLGLKPEDVFPYPAIWALQRALLEHHLCFKHPSFREEREWRLIKLVDVREELRLLDDRRSDEMMAATRERMLQMGVDWPSAPEQHWPRTYAEGIEVKFRRSAMGLVPYIVLPLRDPAGIFAGRLPLRQVEQGPTANPELALESLIMFLDSHGYGSPHTEVKASDIPLR